MNIEETEIIDENSKPKDKLKAWYLYRGFIAGTQHLTNEQIGYILDYFVGIGIKGVWEY